MSDHLENQIWKMMSKTPLPRRGKFPLPLLSFCGWTNNTIDTSKINRRKKKKKNKV